MGNLGAQKEKRNDTPISAKKEWGVVMEKEKLKILEELRRIFI